MLQRGYGAGDLSIVYPVARGTGPLLASIAAIVWLGEPAGLHSIAGLALVVSGTFTIAGGLRTLRGGATAQTRRGLAWGLATGVLIAAYTVNDGRAVSVLGATTQQASGLPSLKLRQNIEWVERETIRRALENAGGVKKDAAELMGISQRALSYYLAKYRID